jgi:hypothetical protein
VTPSDDGSLHVPKKELVGVLQLLRQGRRLKIARLPERDLLVRGLGNFNVKITTAGNETFEAWRERDHDDLVLAVALACWLGESSAPLVAPTPIADPPRYPSNPREAKRAECEGWVSEARRMGLLGLGRRYRP